MPITPTYPGIYIQEAPSSTHTITAAQTNIAAFIGYTHPLKTVPTNFGKAVPISSFQDYQRLFGGFLRSVAFANAIDPTQAAPDTSFGDMAQAVYQFFVNGGTQAYVVALQSQFLKNLPPLSMPSDPTIPVGTISGAQSTHTSPLTFWAREITDETYKLRVQVMPANPPAGSPPPAQTADIIITYGPAPPPNTTGPVPGTVIETYRQVNLSKVLTDPNYITNRINGVSALVWVTVAAGSPPLSFTSADETLDTWLSQTDWTEISLPTDFTNQMQADTDLDKQQPVFNLMVLPGVTNDFVLSAAQAFCELKRALLVMDPPLNAGADGTDPNTIQNVFDPPESLPTSANAALYFPYLKSPNPFTGLSTDPLSKKAYEIPPAATVAGVMARTDVSRGVWKAPAGFQATTSNTTGVVDRGRMSDQRQGVLNPLGINCLRDFANIGTVVYGARTTVTMTDQQSRYVPVRRMTLFLEQSLYASLGWVVFEPNAEPLWSAITMSINAFMFGLFRQGAFQGDTPSEAFSVLCNSTTTTQTDIDNGIVNIVVAFAPLKPAEFVVITIAQMAGQTS